MVNDGTSNALVYLDGEQVRCLLDLNLKQWNKLEELVGQVGEVNLNLVLNSSSIYQKPGLFCTIIRYQFVVSFLIAK